MFVWLPACDHSIALVAVFSPDVCEFELKELINCLYSHDRNIAKCRPEQLSLFNCKSRMNAAQVCIVCWRACARMF